MISNQFSTRFVEVEMIWWVKFCLYLVQVSSFCTVSFCRVRNLRIGTEYDFRVMAENHYGMSDPAMTRDPIKARHPFGKEQINLP